MLSPAKQTGAASAPPTSLRARWSRGANGNSGLGAPAERTSLGAPSGTSGWMRFGMRRAAAFRSAIVWVYVSSSVASSALSDLPASCRVASCGSETNERGRGRARGGGTSETGPGPRSGTGRGRGEGQGRTSGKGPGRGVGAEQDE